MRTLTMQHRGLIPAILSCTLALAGLPACGDDDTDATDAGAPAAGKGSGGKGGTTAGGKGGSTAAGKGGAGGKAGAGGKTSAGAGGSESEDSGAQLETDTKAADLRVTLNLLLSEHLVLAAKATGAALGSRTDEFNAYGDKLNTNGTDVGALVGAAFGKDAESKFNGIWSAHNGYFVDYTKAVAAKNQVDQDKAVKNLTDTYVPDFAKFLAGPTGLPEATLTDLTKEHVLTTKAIVDEQYAALTSKDYKKTYEAIRKAFAHMQMIGNPLAIAIAGKLPNDFPGDAASKAVSFRVNLNQLLQEHLYLATFATDAALAARTEEFAAAGDALNTNGTDIGGAIGDLYDATAEAAFNGIWSAHNGYFVDYTKAVAANNDADKQKAVDNLTNKYVPDFASLLNTATGLPLADLKTLTGEHVSMTKAVVDAQHGTDWGKTAGADVDAARHMQHIGDPLAKAIVGRKPEKF